MEPAHPAEEKLLKALLAGESCVLAEARPDAATKANTIRAAFLRHLLIDPEARGALHLRGAYIEGALNLAFATVRPFALDKCHIPHGIHGPGATCAALALPGTHTGPLNLDSATISGSVSLRYGFKAMGTVRLAGAKIDKTLDCSGGTFINPKGCALNGDGMQVKGAVFFRNDFKAQGEVRLVGARIGGNLECTSSTFITARGEEDAWAASALILQSARVENVFVLDGADIRGSLNLMSAHVHDLCDTPDSWPSKPTTDEKGKEWPCHIFLDGFAYDRIVWSAPTDAATRLEWLERQPPDHRGKGGLRPQPWRRLIAVLRDMGHDEAAREVGIDLRRRQWDALLTAWRAKGWGWALLGRVAHLYWKWTCTYGMGPVRLVAFMAAVWSLCGAAYMLASWLNDDACWPFAYSLDLMLPVLSLGQAGGACAPEGFWWQLLGWAQVIFGWAGALTLAAIATRLVRRD